MEAWFMGTFMGMTSVKLLYSLFTFTFLASHAKGTITGVSLSWTDFEIWMGLRAEKSKYHCVRDHKALWQPNIWIVSVPIAPILPEFNFSYANNMVIKIVQRPSCVHVAITIITWIPNLQKVFFSFHSYFHTLISCTILLPCNTYFWIRKVTWGTNGKCLPLLSLSLVF